MYLPLRPSIQIYCPEDNHNLVQGFLTTSVELTTLDLQPDLHLGPTFPQQQQLLPLPLRREYA